MTRGKRKSTKRVLKRVAVCVLVLLTIAMIYHYYWGNWVEPLNYRLDKWIKTLNSENSPYLLFGILGGLLAIILATWRSWIGERQVRVAIKGQYSERFVKATEQAASDQLAIRLGGLASLQALSDETREEYVRVWSYLCAFLRHPPTLKHFVDKKGAGDEEILVRRPDVAMIIGMLREHDQGRLGWIKNYRFDLTNAKLAWALLEGANLKNAMLWGGNLKNAKMWRANLENANLVGANLEEVMLHDANLKKAKLAWVNLKGAMLMNANLKKATLTGNLTDAALHEANLTKANLKGANLTRATLWKATLTGANLEKADLTDANLGGG